MCDGSAASCGRTMEAEPGRRGATCMSAVTRASARMKELSWPPSARQYRLTRAPFSGVSEVCGASEAAMMASFSRPFFYVHSHLPSSAHGS